MSARRIEVKIVADTSEFEAALDRLERSDALRRHQPLRRRIVFEFEAWMERVRKILGAGS